MSILLALQAIATCVVLSVLLYLLVRSPRNVPLRAVTVTVGSFSLTVVFGTAASTGVTFLGLAPILSRLIQHLGMVVGGYSLIVFYIFSALATAEARRQAVRQAIPFVVAALILIVDTVLMPAELRDPAATLAFTRPGAPQPHGITTPVLYVTPNLSMGYAFAAALLWTRRYARGAEPRLRVGLTLTSLGLAALVFGEAVFVTATIAQWSGVAVPKILYSVGLYAILPGSAVFMVGFAYPAVHMRLAALRVWWQHRRVYRRLGPLWTLLHQQFPEDALTRVPASRWRDAVRLRGVHRRYYRRVIECRDGLLRISPYLTADGAPVDCPAALADRLRDGLRACAAGLPTPSRPVPVAIPDGGGLDADARELVTLSEALARHG